MTDTSTIDRALRAARVRRRLPPPPARRQLREAAGISQLDVAQALGVTREAVSLWESGLRTPRAENAAAYVALLDRLAQERMA